jgi:hypothetical protein
VINIITHPQWVELRMAILVALEPHPEVREGVLRAVEEVSTRRAG